MLKLNVGKGHRGINCSTLYVGSATALSVVLMLAILCCSACGVCALVIEAFVPFELCCYMYIPWEMVAIIMQ